MITGPDFIGLGVEKAGTSWIFACLYEHPEVCIPVKEINFFSDAVLWEKGQASYEAFFQNRCSKAGQKGEFSTNYFYHSKAAERIHCFYPNVKLLVCLRHPAERAFSNYLNDIKAGTIRADLTFEQAIQTQDYYLEQGKYKEQLERYFRFFKKEQLKILIYEDIQKAPLNFIQSIYQFIGIDPTFVPPSLHKKINTGRVPTYVQLEKWTNRIAASLQNYALGERIWWTIKRSGIPQILRGINTSTKEQPSLSAATYQQLANFFHEDISYIEQLLNRKLWTSTNS